jgi:dihydroorotase
MSHYLWVKGGRIIDPANSRDEVADLFAKDGLIVDSLSADEKSKATIVDAVGKVVCPGFVDLNTSLCEPGGSHREGIRSGARAAAAGGYTSILAMPNTNPPCDTAGTIQFIKDAVARESVINIFPTGCLTKAREGQFLASMGSLKKAGIVAVTDSGKSLQNNALMERAVEYAKMFGLVVMDPCMDDNLTEGSCMNEGAMSLRLGLRGSPRAAEDIMVSRNVILSTYNEAHIHLQSISSENSVEIIRRAKQRGIKVTADTTPHHIYFTDDCIAGYDTRFKTNPPIREASDVKALIEGLLDGTIDCIATNHRPYTRDEKDIEFDRAPAGIIGLETALNSAIEVLYRKHKFSLLDVVKLLSTNPAKLMKLSKGTLSIGADADIVVFDPDEERYLTEETLYSKSKNSPWLKKTLPGVIHSTCVAGQLVFEHGEFLIQK